MKKFLDEFIAFIKRGNALDLAVGIIIGGAFQKIVSSLVNDVIMPLFSIIIGVNISEAKWILRSAIYDGDTLLKAEIALKYGSFFQTIIDFLIIALAIFVGVKIASKISKGFHDAKEEITTLVKKKKKGKKAKSEEITVENKEIEQKPVEKNEDKK